MNRILTDSYRGIFTKTHSLIVSSLKALGVDIDGNSLSIHPSNPHDVHKGPSTTSNTCYTWMDTEFSISSHSISQASSVSSVCDGLAERIRMFLENELGALSRDILQARHKHHKVTDYIYYYYNITCLCDICSLWIITIMSYLIMTMIPYLNLCRFKALC